MDQEEILYKHPLPALLENWETYVYKINEKYI